MTETFAVKVTDPPSATEEADAVSATDEYSGELALAVGESTTGNNSNSKNSTLAGQYTDRLNMPLLGLAGGYATAVRPEADRHNGAEP